MHRGFTGTFLAKGKKKQEKLGVFSNESMSVTFGI